MSGKRYPEEFKIEAVKQVIEKTVLSTGRKCLDYPWRYSHSTRLACWGEIVSRFRQFIGLTDIHWLFEGFRGHYSHHVIDKSADGASDGERSGGNEAV